MSKLLNRIQSSTGMLPSRHVSWNRPMSPNSNKWLESFEILVPDLVERLFRQYLVPENNAQTLNNFTCDAAEILEEISNTFQCVHPVAVDEIQKMICSLYFLIDQDFREVKLDPFMMAIGQYRKVVGVPGYVNNMRMETRIQNLCEFVAYVRKLSEFVLKSPPAELPNPRFRTAGSYYNGPQQGILKKTPSNPYMNQQSQGQMNMGQMPPGMNYGQNQMQPGMNYGTTPPMQQQGMNYGNQYQQQQDMNYGTSATFPQQGNYGQQNQYGQENQYGQQNQMQNYSQQNQMQQQGMNGYGPSQQGFNGMGSQQGFNGMGSQPQQGFNGMGSQQNLRGNNSGGNINGMGQRSQGNINRMGQRSKENMNGGMGQRSQGNMNGLGQMPQGNMNGIGQMDPNIFPAQPQDFSAGNNGQFGPQSGMTPEAAFNNGQNFDGQQPQNQGMPIEGNCRIDFNGVSSDNEHLEKMLNSAIANAFQKGYQCQKTEKRCPPRRKQRCAPAPNCGLPSNLVNVPGCAPRRAGCSRGGTPGNSNREECPMMICGKSFKAPPSITNFESIRPLKIPGFDLFTQPPKCGFPPPDINKCQPQPNSCMAPKKQTCPKPPPGAWRKPIDSCNEQPTCLPMVCVPPPPPCPPPPQQLCPRKPRKPLCPPSRCPEPPGNILCILPAPMCEVRVRDTACSNTNFCKHKPSKYRARNVSPGRRGSGRSPGAGPDGRKENSLKRTDTNTMGVNTDPFDEKPRRKNTLEGVIEIKNTQCQTEAVEQKEFGCQVEIVPDKKPSFGGDIVGKSPSLPSVRGSGVFSNPELVSPKQNCSAVFRIRLEGPDFQCVAPTVELESSSSSKNR